MNNNKQKGFGESALFPVIACIGISSYLVLPHIIELFQTGFIVPSIVMTAIIVALTLWLASLLFADFVNLLIIVLVVITWRITGSWLIGPLHIGGYEIFQNQDFISLGIISVYLFFHALILTLMKHLANAK